MADFQAHINQAKSNYQFLKDVNHSIHHSYDWQVTICFYCAVHLVNAHLAKKVNLHYNTHKEVNNAISFANQFSAAKIDQPTYIAYIKLRNLSRRSRYLCKDVDNPAQEAIAHLTSEKHLIQALKQLDTVIAYFENQYKIGWEKLLVNCSSSSELTVLNYFAPYK